MSFSDLKDGPMKSEQESELELYVESISDSERLEYQLSSLHELIQEIQILGAKRSHARANEAFRLLTPFISFIDRYSKAVDNMVQYAVSPSCLIWGCLRVIIRVGQSLPYYFNHLLSVVERFGSELCLYSRYDEHYHEDKEFKLALSSTYMDALVFLRKARDALRTNGSLSAWIWRAWKNFEQEFEEIMQRLRHRLDWLNHLSTVIHREVMHREKEKQEEFRLQTRQTLHQIAMCSTSQADSHQNQLSSDIISWLSPVDYQEDLRRNKEKCAPNTCQWIFSNPFFQNWARDEVQRLGWIYGNSGIGKTVLAGSIIKTLSTGASSLSSDSAVTVYFFFDGTDESRNNTLAMLRTIIFQLSRQFSSCRDHTEVAFAAARNYGRTHMSWLDVPLVLLGQVLAVRTPIFIVLDGLDECIDIETKLGEFLHSVQSVVNCHVLLLSRDVPHIRNAVGGCHSLHMTGLLTKEDIDMYFCHVTQDLNILDSRHRNKILSDLSTGADGMFLWAHFMTQELKSAVCPDDVVEVAATTPIGLSHYYELVVKKLARAPPKWLELAQNVFLRVLLSPRPLTWAELQCSLTLDSDETPGTAEQREGRLPYKSAVIKVCQPFIEYHRDGDYFRPTHVSVLQFFTAAVEEDSSHELHIHPQTGHRRLAKILLNYLHEPDVSAEAALETGRFPLMAYATSYWCHHLLLSEPDSGLRDLTISFLSCDKRRRAWLMHWLMVDSDGFPLHKIFRMLREVQKHLQGTTNESISWHDELQDTVMVFITLDEAYLRNQLEDAAQPTVLISNPHRDMTIRDLVRVYKMENRLDDGISHFKEGMLRMERIAGAKPEDCVWLLNGLGLLYDQQGRIDLAVETQQKALFILNGSPESKEIDKVLTINELGRLYRHSGRFAESQEMHRQALRSLRSMFPETGILEIWTISHLAKCYRQDGRLDEALKLHNKALALRTRLLGLEHPHTLWDLSDVAKCHRELGALGEACRIQEESIRLRRKTIGVNHNDTLWAMNDLGLMYERDGRLDDAIRLHTQAWEGQKLTLGQGHETTAWSSNEIQKLKLAAKV